MSTFNEHIQKRALRLLSDEIGIPASLYEKAKLRYESLGAWLDREGSTIAKYLPKVFPQGSFRLGTVKLANGTYDLDIVCELTALSKEQRTQAWVHEAIGFEIKSYALAHGMKAVPVLKTRCWHLQYAEDGGIDFHIDILTSIPEDEVRISELISAGVAENLAEKAIAFSNKKHEAYSRLSQDWPMSNPAGFGKWFDGRMRGAAQRVLQERAEELPPHRWNTPLQKAIRIIKGHRDTMFLRHPELKPSSIIISTLAAEAYDGQAGLRETVRTIVEQMPYLVEGRRVLNPTNYGENFADKWAEKPELEEAFIRWTGQLKVDLNQMGYELGSGGMKDLFENRFGLSLGEDRFRAFAPEVQPEANDERVASFETAKAIVAVPNKPWLAR